MLELSTRAALVTRIWLVKFSRLQETNLYSFVAVSWFRLHLCDNTRSNLNCGNRFSGTVVVVVSCHSDLSTEKSSDSHFDYLLFLSWINDLASRA